MSAELVYPYRQSPGRLVLAILLFGLAGAYFLHLAAGNRRGMTIDYIIRLRPDEAAIAYDIFATLSFLFVALGLYGLFVAMTKRLEIAVGPSGIRLPVGLARRETTIAYADIKSIQHQKIRSTEFLTITPRAGKRAVISAIMLPSKEVFAQIRAELTARARTAQQL
jgi:hypothetical protein